MPTNNEFSTKKTSKNAFNLEAREQTPKKYVNIEANKDRPPEN